LLLAAVAIIAAAALAQPNETTGIRYQAIGPVTAQPVREQATVKQKLAPLKLPNIAAMTKALWSADRTVLPKQATSSANVIRFWNGKGRWLRAPRHEKCAEVPWQRSCTVARASLRLHTALLNVAEKRLLYELPETNDWVTAVQIAQRPYPNTKWPLLALSDREGGWGPWVWYSGACGNPPCLWQGYHVGGDNVSGADTVGGWMQFRYSTFAPYWRQAQADLKRRGFLIPEIGMPPEGGPTKYAGWLSPLGQALTAGYMFYYHKQGCHWCI
jgi:hypothetical protein